MKAMINNGLLEILTEPREELEVFKNSVYSDRVIVFKTIKEDVLQEFHFDTSTGNLINRAARKLHLPRY